MNITAEDIERIKLDGPRNFSEAEIVHLMFARVAQAALLEGNAHEILRYLGQLHDWGRQLVAARLCYAEEQLRREREVPSPLRVLTHVMNPKEIDRCLSDPDLRERLGIARAGLDLEIQNGLGTLGRQLAETMSDISQQCYQAGWMNDLEYTGSFEKGFRHTRNVRAARSMGHDVREASGEAMRTAYVNEAGREGVLDILTTMICACECTVIVGTDVDDNSSIVFHGGADDCELFSSSKDPIEFLAKLEAWRKQR